MKFHFYIPRNKQNMQAVQTMETVTKRFELKSEKGYIEYSLRSDEGLLFWLVKKLETGYMKENLMFRVFNDKIKITRKNIDLIASNYALQY